jgi:tRNA threonylcarbamoyladenosine biosynthesis protein TsaE
MDVGCAVQGSFFKPLQAPFNPVHNAAMDVISHNETQTEDLAKTLSAQLQSGDILLFYGALGSGKTTLARALIRTLCDDPDLEVPSPTFTLVQTYDSRMGTIAHFDLYRLEAPEEIYELGWEEAGAGGIIIAEWPERLGALKPRNHIEITLAPIPGEPDARRISWRRIAAEGTAHGL